MTWKRTFSIELIVGALLFSASHGSAQDRSWQLYLGAGPSVPAGTLGDEAQTGYHLQGSALFDISFLPFDLRTDLFYQNFNSVKRENSVHRSLGGEWYRQLGGVLSAKYGVGQGSIRPYALLGVTWAREWHDDRTYWTDLQTSFNGNAGAGVDFPIGPLGGFVEARYLNLFGGEPLATRPPAVYSEVEFRTIPIIVGVRF